MQTAAAAGAIAASPYLQESKKSKLLQQQLVLLLHAHKCFQRERENAEALSKNRILPNMPCSMPHCLTMKGVLVHMTTCNKGRVCDFSHCASSRQIIAHWKNCNREDCPVCKPLRKIQDTPMAFNFSPFPEIVSVPEEKPPNSNGSVNNNNGMTNGTGGGSQLEDRPPVQPALRIDPKDPIPNVPAPGVHPNAKEWQRTVTSDLRNRLLEKLVKAIFPKPEPNSTCDVLVKEFISYEKKVEEEIFKVADSLDQYFDLITEEFYQIQKELQDKKNMRLAAGTASQDQDQFTNNIPSTSESAEMMDIQPPGANEQQYVREGASIAPYHSQPAEMGDDPFVQGGYCPLGKQYQQQQSMQMAEQEMDNMDIGDDWELIEN